MLKTALLIVALVAQVFAQQTVYIDPLNPGRVRSVPLAQSAPGSGDVATAGTNVMTGYTNFTGGSFSFPQKTVATLPSAASNTSKIYRVTDGASAQDCTVGGGSTSATCYSNGSAWISMFSISVTTPLVLTGTGLSCPTCGDASTNTSSSIDSEVALFSSTGGKTFKRATQTGVAKLASGVLGVVSGTSTNCVLVDGTSTPCSGATGLADPGSNGMLARTASNTTAARTLTSSDSTISWANGNGVSANPDATVNSALVMLRSTDQSGVGRYCASADSAGTTYTCALSPTLNVLDFIAGSTFLWTRSASCTSGTSLTLNINGLGAKSVFAADGSTVLTTAECIANRPLHLAYNGTHFRVIGGGVGGGVGDALVANPLSQFAATTSTQLRGVLSDETGGSGGAVFAGSPTITTPTIAGATVTGVADFSGATSFIAKRGTGAPSSTDCDASGEEGSIYVRTGDPASVPTQVYHCTKTGASSWAWHPISHKIGATDPATCDEGQLFYNTTSDTLRVCTAANTWGAIGGGSSTGTAHYYYKAGQAAIGGTYALGAAFSAAPSTVAALVNLGDSFGGGFYLPDTAGNGVVLHHALSDWTGSGNITVAISWMWDGGGGGSGVWRQAIGAVCVAAGDAQVAIGSWNVVEGTSSSQTNSDRIKTDSINIDTTGCATGEVLFLHIYRDAADAADVTTATAKIASVALSYAKTL